MKKALLIVAKESLVVCKALAKVISLIDVPSDICSHEEALATFLVGDYTHVFIVDYSEKTNLESGGFASYRDIKASATGQKIFRCGLERLPYDDYIYLISEVADIWARLQD